MKKITIYYDVVSPYSWFEHLIRLGFEVLLRYRKLWNIELVLKPVSLKEIMQQSGNSPPGQVPFKAKYMFKDLMRSKDFYQVPLKFPSNFPAGTFNAQLALCVVSNDRPDLLETCSRALWMSYWSKDQGIDQTCVINALGPLDPTIVSNLKQKQQDYGLRILTENTKQALQLGAFGAPWIHVEFDDRSEIFFGSDRFEAIAHFLQVKYLGPNPVDSKL
jgi:glutathione S-transferase kappa 1